MKLTRLLACIALALPLSSSAQFLELYYYVPTNEPFPIPIFYEPLATGDFTGNGIDDVVTEKFRVSYSQANGAFSVFNFSPPSNRGAQDITAADFTGDGYDDIVTNSLYTQNLNSFLHENNGNGNILQVSPIIPTNNGNPVYQGATNELAHADMDGDGIEDIVRTSGFGFDGEYYSNMVQVLRNDDYSGVWEFYLAASYQIYEYDLTYMVLGDLSGNGREDVLFDWRLNDFNSPVELRWVENNSTPGNIAFEPTTTIRSAFRPFLVSDVDGDGANDILGYDIAGTQFSWLPNLGDGNFGEPVAINPLQNGVPTSIGSPKHLLAEDLNGDGFLDLVMGRAPFSGVSPIYVLTNDGTGQYSLFQEIPEGGGSYSILLSDVTGNGVKELVRSSSDGITIYSWPTSCTPTAPTSLSANSVEGGLMLSWVPFTESVRCRIQAGTSMSGPFQYINVVGDELGEIFVPANLITPGVTYGWRVRCFCEGDPNDIPGAWSNINYVEYNSSDQLINTTVFPNPSMGEVRLSANMPDYTVRVYDLSGRILLERYTAQNDLVIESGELSHGMYILIFDHNGVLSSKQLSIQQ